MLGQATTVIDPVSDRPKPLKRRTNGISAKDPFKRYALGSDPVTPMPLPGTPGQEWVAEGLTHNEVGLPASGAGAHVAQINKRANKIQRFDAGNYWGECWGEGDVANSCLRFDNRAIATGGATPRRCRPSGAGYSAPCPFTGPDRCDRAGAIGRTPSHRDRAESQWTTLPSSGRPKGHPREVRKRRAAGPLAVPPFGNRFLCHVMDYAHE